MTRTACAEDRRPLAPLPAELLALVTGGCGEACHKKIPVPPGAPATVPPLAAPAYGPEEIARQQW